VRSLWIEPSAYSGSLEGCGEAALHKHQGRAG
jgi:hypothetical protein